MGRLTPSFRVVYGEVLEELRREIRDSFMDLKHKEAFDLLYKKAGIRKKRQWANQLFRVDGSGRLVMVGNIHNRKLISELSTQIRGKVQNLKAYPI